MKLVLKKYLGQHFLVDESITKQIFKTLQNFNFNQLLEIGPGGGALTKYLISLKNIDLKLVEIDIEKIVFLQKQFPQLTDKLIHKDFLKMPLPFENNFVIIGNFPYNISSQILFRLLEWRNQVPIMIGMFQKEVANRIIASKDNKDYGILSVLVQTFYEASIIIEVPPTAFKPPPKVESAVLIFKRIENPILFKSEILFFNVVKSAFNQRRKMLRNPLKQFFSEIELQDPIFTKRAENLSKEDFASLTYKMKITK